LTYFTLTGLRREALLPWLGPVSLLRLADDVPEERGRLIALIEQEFGEPR